MKRAGDGGPVRKIRPRHSVGLSGDSNGTPSPVSTGGGGTRFEHRYGGSVLAALLADHGLPGLDVAFVPERVAFQQYGITAVDDYLITARSGSITRKIHLACRLRPILAASDSTTVKLFAAFLREIDAQLAPFNEGKAVLNLVVKGPYGSAGWPWWPGSRLVLLPGRNRPGALSAGNGPRADSGGFRTAVPDVFVHRFWRFSYTPREAGEHPRLS